MVTEHSYYQQVFVKSPIGMVVCDLTGQCLDANDSLCKIVGAAREEVLAQNFNNLESWERSGLRVKAVEAIESQTATTKKVTLTSSFGKELTAIVSFQPFSREGKGYLLATFEDITELEKAEQELERRTAFLDKIIESSALSLWISDKNGTVIRANQACLDFFGAREEEVLGKYNIFRDEVIRAKGFMPVIEKVFSEGQVATIVVDYDFANVEHVQVKGATHKIVQSVITPVMGEDGKVANVIFQSVDLTEIKKTEEALRKSEERFRLAFLTSPDAININKMDGTYVEINQGFTELTGYTREDVIGKSSLDLMIWEIPEDREKLIEGLKKRGLVKNLESTFRMKDGSSKIGLMSAGIIDLDGEKHILSVTKDITGLREAEKTHQELEFHIRQTQRLESLGVLAGGLAHDFNNILAAILGNINLALLDQNLTDRTKKFLEEAEKASLRAKTLTQQLLTFAKGGEPVKELSSLADVVKDSADFVLHGSNVACNYAIPDDLWLVDIDKGQISQVIQNIVLNGIHAMPKGGVVRIYCENVTFEKTESSPDLPTGEFVKISISDSGIGIPEKHLEKIFDPYFSTKQKGSGLGLAICQSIISKHDGYIAVDSMPGSGSTFSIYLPISESGRKLTTQKHDMPEHLPTAKVLIMDDEPMVRDVAEAMFTTLGNEVILAADGEEAIKLYKEAMDSPEPVQLVIMDLTIPGGMGGKEAVREIHKLDPEARVVVTSGYSNDPILANYKDYGFWAAIVKPFQIKDLKKVLSSLQGAGQGSS